tara:strand:- start:3192 stop:4244 length:1053 start_codon:yes stop_codon:yes gene_type:complete
MAEIIALGCGLVGNFVVKKLSNMGIHIHVVDLVIPDDVKTSNKVTFQEGDIFQLLNKLPKSNIVLNLLPGSIGEQIRPMLIGMEMHVIDLAFTEIEPTIHNQTAIEHDTTLIWDVGIAPGLSNMIIRKEFENDDKINEITIKVGGNPAQPDNDWSYMAPFSPADVIEEYTRPARILKQGKISTVDALTDLHQINVAGYGTMEAFLTDGLRSLLNSAMAPNMREYTVRWPGHIQKWIAEKGALSDNELLEAWKFDRKREEFTWMEIKLCYSGHDVIWEILDDGKDGFSSMARSTGLVTIACAVDLMSKMKDAQKSIKTGVLAPEDLDLESIDRVIEFLKSEGVAISRQVTK